MISENAAALGVPHIQIVEETAPAALAGFERPDAVFIGGGITVEGLVEVCWNGLKPGGRLVANVVTVEGERVMADHQARLGGFLTRIGVSRAEDVGRFQGWRPLMPVTQWSVTKSWEDRA